MKPNIAMPLIIRDDHQHIRTRSGCRREDQKKKTERPKKHCGQNHNQWSDFAHIQFTAPTMLVAVAVVTAIMMAVTVADVMMPRVNRGVIVHRRPRVVVNRRRSND